MHPVEKTANKNLLSLPKFFSTCNCVTQTSHLDRNYDGFQHCVVLMLDQNMYGYIIKVKKTPEEMKHFRLLYSSFFLHQRCVRTQTFAYLLCLHDNYLISSFGLTWLFNFALCKTIVTLNTHTSLSLEMIEISNGFFFLFSISEYKLQNISPCQSTAYMFRKLYKHRLV